nr:zinc finger protein 235-like [Neodiprion pinetum]
MVQRGENSMWAPAPRVEMHSNAKKIAADSKLTISKYPNSTAESNKSTYEKTNGTAKIAKTMVEKGIPTEVSIAPTCETCCKTFASKRKLTVHIKYVHSSLRPFVCEICSLAFKMKNALKKHMQIIHEGSYKLIPCQVCGYKAKDKSRLKDHYVRRHTSIYATSCYICGMQLKFKRDLTTHINQIHCGPVVCEKCGDVLPNYRSLCNHKKTHHVGNSRRNRNFKCGICSKGFASQKSVDAHRLKQHNNGESCYCDHCSKSFTGKYSLTHHIHNVHREDRPYLCPVCSKTFKMHSLLQLHLFTHTNVKPYRCDICGSTYTQRGSMMLHRRKHPGELPLVPPIKLDFLLKSIQPKIKELAKIQGSMNDSSSIGH